MENTIKEVILEKLRYGIMQYVPEAMIESVDIEKGTGYMAQDIAIRLRGFVWAEEKSAQHQEFSYPLNWWQAFKERWSPKWALKKWPVQYRKIVIDVRAIYPEFKPALPDHKMKLSIYSQYELPKFKEGRDA